MGLLDITVAPTMVVLLLQAHDADRMHMPLLSLLSLSRMNYELNGQELG